MSGIGEPYFAEDLVYGGVRNVTAQLGLTTYLHCKVNNLNGKTVSNTDYRKSSLDYLVAVVRNKGLYMRTTKIWL